MNIISTYREVGSYRGAAELCGTTHKTVKRVVERAEAGGEPRQRSAVVGRHTDVRAVTRGC